MSDRRLCHWLLIGALWLSSPLAAQQPAAEPEAAAASDAQVTAAADEAAAAEAPSVAGPSSPEPEAEVAEWDGGADAVATADSAGPDVAPDSAADSVTPPAEAPLERSAVSPGDADPAETSADSDPVAASSNEIDPAAAAPASEPNVPAAQPGEPATLPGEPVTPAVAGGTYGLLDKARLDAWLDGLVEASMMSEHLPGVVLSVVEGDRLVTSRGWGLANIEQRRLADPASSLFRIGSISKVVTATALLRLAEQGALDPQQSVARYLDPLPFPDGEAVTLVHLLTHQAGFEDSYLGHFYAVDAQTDHELLPYLSQYAPRRVRDAGQLSSYSNYGYAVLGAVVAEVSGDAFEAHMDQLLGEWGMGRSSYRERSGVPREDDLPEALADHLAEGYRWSGWRQQRSGSFWMHRGMAPAGAMLSTAEDMARFMRLHLRHGNLDGRQLLQTATLDRMHTVLTRHHEAVGGNAYGFWARELSGLRTIEHAGAVLHFHSNMVLLPEPGIGIFVSTNGSAGRQFVQDLPRLLVEQFLASRQPAPLAPAADFAQRAVSYDGIYRSTRRNYSSFEAAGTVLGEDTRISHDAETGVLLLTDGRGTQAYRERSAGVFESERDGSTLAFSGIADGPAARAWPAYGHTVLERVPWYARAELFEAVACGVLLLSVLRLLGLRLRQPARGGWLEHSTAGLAWLTALGWLGFAVGLFGVIEQLSGNEPAALARYPDQQVIWTLLIGLVTALLSVLCLPLCLAVWQRGQWPLWRRLHLWLFVLASLLLIPLLWYWRLLGFHFHGVANPWLPPL